MRGIFSARVQAPQILAVDTLSTEQLPALATVMPSKKLEHPPTPLAGAVESCVVRLPVLFGRLRAHPPLLPLSCSCSAPRCHTLAPRLSTQISFGTPSISRKSTDPPPLYAPYPILGKKELNTQVQYCSII
eukprot:1844297-Rhodomonas_salina.3